MLIVDLNIISVLFSHSTFEQPMQLFFRWKFEFFACVMMVLSKKLMIQSSFGRIGNILTWKRNTEQLEMAMNFGFELFVQFTSSFGFGFQSKTVEFAVSRLKYKLSWWTLNSTYPSLLNWTQARAHEVLQKLYKKSTKCFKVCFSWKTLLFCYQFSVFFPGHSK